MFSRFGNGKSQSSNWENYVWGAGRVQLKWSATKFVTIGDSHREDTVANRIRLTSTAERNGGWEVTFQWPDHLRKAWAFVPVSCFLPHACFHTNKREIQGEL
jgi:hypothetical protein